MDKFSTHQKRSALNQVERALGQRLWKKEVTDSFLENPTGYFRKWHRPKLRVALETLRLIKRSQGDQLSPEVRKRLRDLRNIIRAGYDDEPHERSEICGHKIKVIASNIRRGDLAWERFSLLEKGIGHEGDILMTEVLDATGSTRKIENIFGRDEALVEGDKVIVVLANRHTSTSEYGGIPKEGLPLTAGSEIELLAHGGIVGQAQSIPARMGSHASKLRVIGFLATNDTPLNLRALFPPWENSLQSSAPLIAFCGTGAEIGKTTAASAFIREFRSRGLKIAATKLAGTGRYRDVLALRDAGADIFYDFPDVGLASTYTSPERYIPAIRTLINKLNEGEPDIIVAEFGGDIIEANIPTFFSDPSLQSIVKSIVHCAGDIMGMKGSLEYYQKWGVNVPIFLAQPKDRNPLGSEVRATQHIGLPLFDTLRKDQVSRIASETEAFIIQQATKSDQI